ncbi:MAG: type 2 isopentenyl-diphosphate Delta-isomerase [Candidatus Lokiarchaeota archaeon]|nr:type 2 isopentenyl-diphosphate Delta-isomerase [Candidatus Lokiarchaeota archaeon]
MVNDRRLNEDRKLDHIKSITEGGMQASRNWMDEVYLHPDAVPAVDPAGVDATAYLFGRKFDAPFYVAAMTGGHPKTKGINEVLARACAKANIPMGVGSQRAALDNEDLAGTFKVARDASDKLFLIANIGMSQIVKAKEPVITAKKCIDMINADAIAIHFNKLQELVQPEGDRNFTKIMDIIEAIEDGLKIPVIVKEVGMGFSRSDYEILRNYRVAAVDTGGFGGTNFSLVEAVRVDEDSYPYTRNLGKTFQDCGTPTPISVMLAKKYTGLPILATGGIRTGLDVVKALCLGADMAGLAYPFLIAALNDVNVSGGNQSNDACTREMETIKAEIKTAMCLLNAKRVGDLDDSQVHVSADLSRWIE